MRASGAVIAALGLVALLLSACERPAPSSEAHPGIVNVYSARGPGADAKLYPLFTERTGIAVHLVEGDADALIDRLRADGAISTADVFLAADGSALWRAQEAGLLQPADSAVLKAAIPEALRDPAGRWFGFTRRARVVAYDPAKVRPEVIDAYEDIAAPRFRGRLCVRSADTAANLSLTGALIEAWGPESAGRWVSGIAANMARPPQGDGAAQVRAIGAGVCDIALVSSLDYMILANSESPADRDLARRIALSFPTLDGQGSHVMISGGGLIAGAPNRANAIRLLEFLGSAEAQTETAARRGEFPASPDLPAPYPMDAFRDFRAHPMPAGAYARHQAQARAIMAAAGWN